MARFSEYEQYDALGLADVIRKGEVSASEVMEAAIERAEDRGAKLNAICHKAYDLGRAEAAAAKADTMFAGAPFLLKDLAAPMPGIPESEGCVLFANSEVPVASAAQQRLKDAGLVTFARTTSAEMGLSFTTDSPIYGGPTLNPWDLKLTPGGSSGGASAAVAAGIVPMAHGNDGAGSIRVPAACCGVYGLKPTRARLPSGPYVGEGWAGIAFSGVISRSVRDTAAALQVSEGADLGAPYPAPPRENHLELIKTPPRRLRIGFVTKTYTGEAIDPACVAAVEEAAKLLESLGHIVEPAQLTYDYYGALKASLDIVCAGTAQSVAQAVKALGREPLEHELSTVCRAAYEAGRRMSAVAYTDAVDATHAAGRQIAAFFVDYDMLLTPTTASPPVAADRYPLTAASLEDYWMGDNGIFKFAPFTQIGNVSGQPAASLPLYWTADDIPIGVHLVARFGEDSTLLQLSAQLEAAKPWFDRRPAMARS